MMLTRSQAIVLARRVRAEVIARGEQAEIIVDEDESSHSFLTYEWVIRAIIAASESSCNPPGAKP